MIQLLGMIMTVLGLGIVAVGLFAVVTAGARDPLLLVWTVIGFGLLWIGITLGKHPNRSIWALVLGIFEVAQWTYELTTTSEGLRALTFLIFWIGFLILTVAAVWFIRNRPQGHTSGS
jgi:hypothetical protein